MKLNEILKHMSEVQTKLETLLYLPSRNASLGDTFSNACKWSICEALSLFKAIIVALTNCNREPCFCKHLG